MKSDIYFLSDAHMGGDPDAVEREKEHRLFTLLDEITDTAEVIYILGDLFDFWFEYRRSIPNTYFRLLRKLSEVRDSGTRIIFIPGNHDVWTGPYLENEIGVEVKRGVCEATHQGLSFYLAHGDGLARGEGLYRLQKWVMENRTCIWLYSLIHPDIGIPLARRVSRWSRNRSSSKTPGWNAEAYKAAAQRILDRGYDAVVLGHTHYPELKRIEGKIYLNTGNLITDFCYGKLSDGRLTLETWSGEKKVGENDPTDSS